jgi:hypothetical protein
MKRTLTIFKRTLLLALATMALSSLSFATILCGGVAQTVAAIAAAGGCQYGSNFFTNVSISTSTELGSAPAGAIDPTQVAVQVTSTSVPDVINVIVSNLTPSNWALTTNGQFTLVLTYTVTGSLPAYFVNFSDSFNGSGTSTGGISFDKMANGQNLPMTLNLAMMSQPPLAFTGSPLSTFNVVDNIQVHANNASATLLNATNTFGVPEPMTSMLLGSGLLAFGFMVRRKRS